MIGLMEWAAISGVDDRPWLILGKGPTFSRHVDFDLSAFNLLALNHVVRELKVDVAHAIDLDVVADCSEAILANARWLVMPRRPHVDCAPSGKKLEEFFAELPVLQQLSEQGRLVWYDLELGSSARPRGRRPVIGARWFSSEAALNVLAAIGASKIRSLGIDGGRGYSKSFQDLEGTTMLANTHSTFDIQFEEIAGIVNRNSLDYAPLVEPDRPEPMRVFVGADESQLVAVSVLEHSLRKHASRPVEFTTMIDLDVPEPKDPANRARTGFSFYRFLIPKLCGYRGRALYLDSDMQVFADLAELWQIPFEDDTVLCTNQPEPPAEWRDDPSFKPGRHLAVMMLDCSRLEWDVDEIVGGLDEGRYGYKELMSDLCIVPEEQIAERIPRQWNSLEHYEPGTTRLVHYTVVPTQPWKNDRNPLRETWHEGFRDALGAGAVDPTLVLRSIEGGHVKASLVNDLHLSPQWTGERPRAPAGSPISRIKDRVRSVLR
jgi:Glycosyl transferase family 8